jgi:hypothetical protein
MNIGTIPIWYMEEVWARDDINEWWLEKHWGPTNNLLSNVRVGDIFSLGKDNQFGLVTRRTLNVGQHIDAYYSYYIAGDIGGHWYHPKHEWFRVATFEGREDEAAAAGLGWGSGYARFMPQATQLMEMWAVLGVEEYKVLAGRLLDWYEYHPFTESGKWTDEWKKHQEEVNESA